VGVPPASTSLLLPWRIGVLLALALVAALVQPGIEAGHFIAHHALHGAVAGPGAQAPIAAAAISDDDEHCPLCTIIAVERGTGAAIDPGWAVIDAVPQRHRSTIWNGTTAIQAVRFRRGARGPPTLVS
jgi:hypothetical protein